MYKKHLLLLTMIAFFAAAQTQNAKHYQYVDPAPGSVKVTPQHNIAIRHGKEYRSDALRNLHSRVTDAQNNPIDGEWVIADDRKTLVFNAESSFRKGAIITVQIKNLLSKDGKRLPELLFSFKTRKNNYNSQESMDRQFPMLENLQAPQSSKMARDQKQDLPDDFPSIEVTVSDDPKPGYTFAAPFGEWGMFEEQTPYLMILDNTGYPVYYKRLEKNASDFKVHPTGDLSYFYGKEQKHMILNKKMEVVDTYECQNGYPTDFHEFKLLDNGHALLLGYDDRVVDMDTVVDGGHEGVTVRGTLIQELDSDKNVIFEWSSWDSFQITDAADYVNLQDENFIDYVHANALEPTPDGGVLISSRNFSEITKIDRETGEVVWRLSGENNQFEFMNDTLGFSAQHDIRYHGDNIYSLFDNGWENTNEEFSSMVEYELDTEAMTATQTRRIRSTPEDIYGRIMGNVQYLSDDRFFVGWGSGVPNITEFRADGSKALEFSFPAINYRAYKFDFQQQRFVTSADTLNFGYIQKEETIGKSLTITNNSEEDILINTAHFRSDKFRLANNLAVIIPAKSSEVIGVLFDPGGEQGRFKDVVTLSWDVDNDEMTRRLSRQVALTGYASETDGIGAQKDRKLEVYPNPAKNYLFIQNTDEPFNGLIEIFSMEGKQVLSKQSSFKNKTKVNTQSLSKGIYLLKLSGEGENHHRSRLRKKLVIR